MKNPRRPGAVAAALEPHAPAVRALCESFGIDDADWPTLVAVALTRGGALGGALEQLAIWCRARELWAGGLTRAQAERAAADQMGAEWETFRSRAKPAKRARKVRARREMAELRTWMGQVKNRPAAA